eukprot:gene3846-biopygen3161
MVGAGLLWVGWFGFNAGSNLEANGYAALAMVNTFIATAAAGFSWVLVEWVTRKKASMLGMASGIVAGLVAITPAAGFAGPLGALVLGLVVSPICVFFCSAVKNALKYDDSLDAFGIHAVGGIIGDIFAHRATGEEIKPFGNAAMFEAALAAWERLPDGGFCFVNLVDFDTEFGHRRDVPGYAAALEAFDAMLPRLEAALRPGDLGLRCRQGLGQLSHLHPGRVQLRRGALGLRWDQRRQTSGDLVCARPVQVTRQQIAHDRGRGRIGPDQFDHLGRRFLAAACEAGARAHGQIILARRQVIDLLHLAQGTHRITLPADPPQNDVARLLQLNLSF